MSIVKKITVEKSRIYFVDGELLEKENQFIINNNAIANAKVKASLRDAFIPPEGWLWFSADYSAQEMRVMAILSNEKNLIDPILNGEDIHKYVATKMFSHYDPTHRTIAKTINFAASYGASGYTIAKRLGLTEEEGNAMLDKYNKALPNLTRWKEEQKKNARRKGFCFTYFGRPREMYHFYQSSDKSQWAFGDRTALNSPIQGFGGDLIRLDHVRFKTLCDTNPEFNENVRYALTVHDEINIFVRPSYVYKAWNIMQKLMNFQPANFPIPICVQPSIGTSWSNQIEPDSVTPDNKVHFKDYDDVPLKELQTKFRSENQF